MRDGSEPRPVRVFAHLVTVPISGAPTLAQADPKVMFQRIIYEGLLGDAFLRDFTVTYDMPGSRAVFAQPTEAPS